jgi:two-component system, chemotaxis family, chemotaxis protein CheY
MSGRSTDTSRRKGRAYTVTMLIENKDATYERMTRPAAHCPVLIVEDDADLREMMAQLLTLEGYETATVANGREALEYLHNAVAPNVILLDLMMPIMDGWEFHRRLEADPEIPPVPVIVLSALDQGRAKNIHAAAFLKKPLDFDRLLDLVRTYCH